MLSNVEMLSLSKVLDSEKLKKAGIRDLIAPGDHPVDFSVRISGVLKVAENYKTSASYRPPVALALAQLLLTFLEPEEIGRELAVRLPKLDRLAEKTRNIKLAAAGVQDVVEAHTASVKKRKKKIDCFGAVTPALAINPLRDEALP